MAPFLACVCSSSPPTSPRPFDLAPRWVELSRSRFTESFGMDRSSPHWSIDHPHWNIDEWECRLWWVCQLSSLFRHVVSDRPIEFSIFRLHSNADMIDDGEDRPCGIWTSQCADFAGCGTSSDLIDVAVEFSNFRLHSVCCCGSAWCRSFMTARLLDRLSRVLWLVCLQSILTERTFDNFLFTLLIVMLNFRCNSWW